MGWRGLGGGQARRQDEGSPRQTHRQRRAQSRAAALGECSSLLAQSLLAKWVLKHQPNQGRPPAPALPHHLTREGVLGSGLSLSIRYAAAPADQAGAAEDIPPIR